MEKNWMELLGQQNQIKAVLKTNEYTTKCGLVLTEQDAIILSRGRKSALREQRRVEFGEGIIPKLIYAFADSPYINQDNYVQTLMELQDLFYRFKNEMNDEITDDELINFMKEQFDTICFGDLEYLGGTCMEVFAEAIRAGYDDYHYSEGYGEYQKFDMVPRWDYQLFVKALEDLES